MDPGRSRAGAAPHRGELPDAHRAEQAPTRGQLPHGTVHLDRPGTEEKEHRRRMERRAQQQGRRAAKQEAPDEEPQRQCEMHCREDARHHRQQRPQHGEPLEPFTKIAQFHEDKDTKKGRADGSARPLFSAVSSAGSSKRAPTVHGRTESSGKRFERGEIFGGGKGLRRQVNSGKEFRERGGFRGAARASFGGGRPGRKPRPANTGKPTPSEAPPTRENRTAGSPVYAGKPPRREPGRGAARPKPRPAYAGKSARKSSQPRSSVSRGASTPFSISEMAAARGSIVARHEVSSGSSAFSPVRSATKRR